ncbi:MAG: tRNA (adenosine(37)-N6)-threonylcarbamoyltransferase complex transferase subunit TsaD [Thermomicrobiales bacterium]|nr:tRNA (adenosine(37)-N6)-threonylcarbamoyltransferase complex transferase subunit TsaD [Thermomicrobiales bacterium]
MNILGIETSCDETAAAVVLNGKRVRSNVISSQIALHQSHGGVVPELAARGHVTAIIPVVEAALAEAEIDRHAIDAIAVTAGPGLAGSLLVGVNAAKALAYALDKPIVPVNHLEGHVYANWLTLPGAEPVEQPIFPVLCLLVSGGHTELILMERHRHYHHLGRTLDDAAGEAFDKGARLLGLGYPGGPAIQRAAATGDPRAFDLPRAWLGDSDDFSFSGLKTALLRLVEPFRLQAAQSTLRPGTPFVEHRPPVYDDALPVNDLAAAYQDAVVEVLAVKAVRAAATHGAKTLVLAGGVAANLALRERIASELERQMGAAAIPFRYPPFALCTDNAAMIAGAAHYAMKGGAQGGWDIDVSPRLPLE